MPASRSLCLVAFFCFWHEASDKHDPGEDFSEDATFYLRSSVGKCDHNIDGKQNRKMFSLESVNFQNHFLKIFDDNIVIEELDGSVDDALFATWVIHNGQSNLRIHFSSVRSPAKKH